MMPALEPVPHSGIEPFDHILVRNTHPPEWRNPKPAGRYNLVVIGAGTAGLVSAAGAAILGARVALVEKNLMGGDCLNYGCVPSKSFLAAARAAHAVRRAEQFGIKVPQPADIQFSQVMQRVRQVRANISEHDSAERFSRLGVDVFFGRACFVSEASLEVEGTRLDFSRAIIATGARAAGLNVPGLKEAGYLTNETVFAITQQPKSMIVIGSGPIGCELGQAFRRLGSKVTMISAERLLPKEDADAAQVLANEFQREGIEMYLNARIVRVERAADAKVVVFDLGHGEEFATAEEILLAVGRTPNVEGLNLESAGVKWDPSGVLVDDRLRTSNRRVYAAGDVASRYQFTHAAEALARIALQNACFFGRKKASSLVIPWSTFTEPEVAHVGPGESQADELRSITLPFECNDRSSTDGDTSGFARVYVDSQSGRLRGATIVGSHAGEMIGELTLAIQKGMKVSELSRVIHPYPTKADVIKRLGDGSLRTRLKPWIKRLLTRWFAWRR